LGSGELGKNSTKGVVIAQFLKPRENIIGKGNKPLGSSQREGEGSGKQGGRLKSTFQPLLLGKYS